MEKFKRTSVETTQFALLVKDEVLGGDAILTGIWAACSISSLILPSAETRTISKVRSDLSMSIVGTEDPEGAEHST